MQTPSSALFTCHWIAQSQCNDIWDTMGGSMSECIHRSSNSKARGQHSWSSLLSEDNGELRCCFPMISRRWVAADHRLLCVKDTLLLHRPAQLTIGFSGGREVDSVLHAEQQALIGLSSGAATAQCNGSLRFHLPRKPNNCVLNAIG